MRLLTATLLATVLLSSSSQASQEVKKSEKKSAQSVTVKSEEEIIKAILKPLSVRGIEVKEIKPTDEVKVPGFRTFEVVLLDKRNTVEIKRYVFISPDGKYLTLEVFAVNQKGGEVHLQPLRPKNSVRKVKVDVSWVKKIDEKLEQAKVPHVIGKSDRKVYIVWDSMCPFCYRHFNKLAQLAKENGVEIHMIPFPIHGEASVKGLLFYAQLAREKGAQKAFEELYKLGGGDFRAYAKRLETEGSNLKLSEEEQKKLKETFKELQEILVKNGVHATPSIIYAPSGDKGYVFVGFKPLREVVKLK
jgi:thiol:disulfide interchange protein DsbC